MNRGEQTLRTVTGSGGRLHFGMVAGIKSERWPTSNRNPWPDCLGIRTDRASGQRPLQRLFSTPRWARTALAARCAVRSAEEKWQRVWIRARDSMGTIVAASGRRRSPGKRRWPSSHEFLEEPDNSLFDFMRPWPLSKAMVSRRMRSQLRFAEGNGRPSVTSPAGTHAAIDAASGEAALAAFEASHGADRPPVTGPRRMLVDGWPLG